MEPNEKSEERIQQEMEQTRASLTEKLETLEQKIVGTVENTTTAVNETVVAIKETVQETVATVQDGVKGSVETVKDAFDIPSQVQKNPWTMVGGSVALGFCLGSLFLRATRPPTVVQSIAPVVSNPGNVNYRTQAPVPAPTAATVQQPEKPGMFEEEVNKIKGLALGVLFGTARELIVSNVPPQLGEQIKDVVDNVTRKVGGEPLASSDWAALTQPVEDLDANAETTTAPTQATQQEQPMQGYPMKGGNGHSARRW
jgi:ElaB/YqjD/DUF883 family membrane-anchored ribosome-binding protein